MSQFRHPYRFTFRGFSKLVIDGIISDAGDMYAAYNPWDPF